MAGVRWLVTFCCLLFLKEWEFSETPVLSPCLASTMFKMPQGNVPVTPFYGLKMFESGHVDPDHLRKKLSFLVKYKICYSTENIIMCINLYTLKYISWLLSIPFVKLLNQYNPIVRSLIWVCFTRTFQQNESESAAKCTKQDFWKSDGID